MSSDSQSTSSAQTRGPRIGHWEQQRGPAPAGLHVTYEDLGDDRFRCTMGAHHVPVNQQIAEGKCDGGTYPFLHGNGAPSGNTLPWDAAAV